MEKYNLKNDIKVFGVEVKTFPQGIGDTFESLAQKIEQGFNRSYYGISNISRNGTIIYKAAAEEKFEGEAEKCGCERYIIEKGEYAMKIVKEWRSKTDTIKDIFNEMMQDKRVQQNSFCIEWYKDDNEMLCLMRANQSEELQSQVKAVVKELLQVLSSFSQKQLNTISYPGSWTAAQVAQHLVLSNSGFAQLVNGPGKETERPPDQFVATIRETFLNFDVKLESPDFVRPAIKDYDKQALLHSLRDASNSIIKGIQADLSETCTTFGLPVLGQVTRLEAINFVVVHTQRHIHQLKKIYKAVAEKEAEQTL